MYEVLFENDNIGTIEIFFHKLDDGFEVFDYDINFTHDQVNSENYDYFIEAMDLEDQLSEVEEEFEFDILYKRHYNLGHRSDKSYSHYYGVWEYDGVTYFTDEDKDYADQVPLVDDERWIKKHGGYMPVFPEEW